MKHIFYVLICIVALASCKKDNKVEPEINLDNLFTNWKLASYEGGIAYQKIIPTDNITITYTQAGNFKSYRNGTVVEDTNFKIKKDNPSVFYSLTYGIVYGTTGGIVQYIQTAKRDTLVLVDNAVDGYKYHYIKNK